MISNNPNNKSFPSIKQTTEIIIIYIIIYLLFNLVVSFLKLTQSLHIPLVFTISIVIVIIYSYKRTHESLNDLIKLRGFNMVIIFPLIITLIGLSPIISEMGNLTRMLIPMPKSIQDTLFKSIRPDRYFWIPYLRVIIIGPITEEILFRGIILKSHLKRYSSLKAIIVSSIFFGIYHLSIWQFIGAIIIGCFFGWLYYKTRSLLPCIFAHVFTNSISIIAIEILKHQQPNNMYFLSKFHPSLIDVIGLLFIGIGIWWLVKIFRKID
jgi:membrane protease YdiL (CAAX protease family)